MNKIIFRNLIYLIDYDQYKDYDYDFHVGVAQQRIPSSFDTYIHFYTISFVKI
ncbi:hypothetical protein BOVA514_1157 [Bacteroides ovatus]|uniref:hypothetical protein n=1 Tax=Bacteroides ovatus TaxID=28116 RepID=UPI000A414D76|nr:hypothetical protein [Bacteroides ovatus]CAG9880707.1 hypothetical protein BOVA115_4660 [Bacteroides ovatus]CAG9889023.1 hypothetical protein BOVA514_1157 [Bacteroides ovatus]